MQLRLDKYLADMGVGTRSEAKRYIRRKQVTVNGLPPKGPEQKVIPGKDQIVFQGKPLPYLEYEYFMLNKPKHCVSAVTDRRYKTVIDLITESNRRDLFPVGRLDIDTEGLMLITNDGILAHQLLAPGKHVPKTYYARVEGRVTKEDVREFAKGLDIGEKKPVLPAELRILADDGGTSLPEQSSEIELTIMEGKFHQVKRMFEAVGKHVTYLKRISMGGLMLDHALLPGEYRKLTEAEINLLKNQRKAVDGKEKL
ncbi:MAG: rRNA pseudouridine synthase [Lachnospiraceae bacterium]|nr:rRNA pseudouridine synthase [Lachnospiraceae bacterium]